MEKRIKPLFLVLPTGEWKTPPTVPHLPSGYALRTYQTGDKAGLATLLESEGWASDEESIRDFLDHVIPDGLFFVLDQETGELISTSSALHHPSSPHWHFPFGGDIGYVVTKQSHQGQGIGYAVSVAATARLTSKLGLCLSSIRTTVKLGGRSCVINLNGHTIPISGSAPTIKDAKVLGN